MRHLSHREVKNAILDALTIDHDSVECYYTCSMCDGKGMATVDYGADGKRFRIGAYKEDKGSWNTKRVSADGNQIVQVMNRLRGNWANGRSKCPHYHIITYNCKTFASAFMRYF